LHRRRSEWKKNRMKMDFRINTRWTYPSPGCIIVGIANNATARGILLGTSPFLVVTCPQRRGATTRVHAEAVKKTRNAAKSKRVLELPIMLIVAA